MSKPAGKDVHGKPMPPFENVAGTYFDQLNRIFVVVTNDILIKQLHRDCPAIAISFDEAMGPALGKISEVLATITTLAMRYILGQDLSDQTRCATCARLLNTAASSFIGSVHLARGGFRLQYMTLVRSVVETTCTVLHLTIDPCALESFHAGKLKSTSSIGVANKVLPGFGQLWGDLSNQFVHISTTHSDLNPINKYNSNDDDFLVIRANMKIVIWLLLVTAELVFIEDFDKPNRWKIINRRPDGNEIAYDPSDEVRIFDMTFFGKDRMPPK